VNGHAIELLALRVRRVSELLSGPIFPGDINEGERTKELEG